MILSKIRLQSELKGKLITEESSPYFNKNKLYEAWKFTVFSRMIISIIIPAAFLICNIM